MQNGVQGIRRFDAERFPVFRHERRRTTHNDVSAEFFQTPNVRPCRSTMGNVTDQRNGQTLDPFKTLPDCQHVEQRLCGMFVCPVTGIQDAATEVFREQFRRTGTGMANNHGVDLHRFDVFRRVDDRFPFREATGRSGKFDDVGTESPCRQGKTRSGSGRVLEKEIDAGFTGKQWNFAIPLR